MPGIISYLGKSAAKKTTLWALSAAALAGLGLTPAAEAGHDRKPKIDVDFEIRIGDRDRRDDGYHGRRERIWVPPEYRDVCEKKWVEPVYETRCEKVWIEPIYETRCERVWIPERYEVREVRRWDHHCNRWVIVHERVCVSPGRWENQEKRVCVREGRWEEVHKKVLVREGHFQDVHRKELVREGYWTWKNVGHAHHRGHDHDHYKHAQRPVEVVNPHVRF